jgi:tripartite-type tricarboxylate transporter receptor subunit TctC
MGRILSVLMTLLLGAAAAQAPVHAADWPDHPIRFIVPFPAGSSSDIVARIVAQGLSAKLGQTFVVENHPGASGALASEFVARAAPDGYTLGLINASFTISPSLTVHQAFDPLKDFAPISMIGASPFVLASYPGVAAHSVQELIALAKAEPGKHTYAEAGPATMANLAGVLFAKLAGIALTPVSYRGTEQEVPDLIAGRVDTAFVTIPPTLPLIQQGQVRALGITGAKRSPALPEVPTIAEAGLAGYEASLWQAINAPAGTPAAILAKLNTATNAILHDRETLDALDRVGVEPDPSTPQQLADRIAADLKKWHDVIVAAGITPQ